MPFPPPTLVPYLETLLAVGPYESCGKRGAKGPQNFKMVRLHNLHPVSDCLPDLTFPWIFSVSVFGSSFGLLLALAQVHHGLHRLTSQEGG